MSEMPSQEVTPSGMSLFDALAVRAAIHAAGFEVDIPAGIAGNPVGWSVSFEGCLGPDTIFSVDQWEAHPCNPNWKEPANW